MAFYAIQLITTVLLGLAANTSFGGLPVLASLLARDNNLPHLFFLKADRQVHRYGISVLAIFAAILLVAARGDTQALVPLFAIGVFVGFTLSQVGMVRHWHEQHWTGWRRPAIINGVGAVLTTAALAIELVSKFTEGAWLIVIIIPLLVLMFDRIHRNYDRIGALLQLGVQPPPPQRLTSRVVVPVAQISRLTAEAISTALAIGDEVTAVNVCYADPDDEAAGDDFRRQWEAWNPNVPLVTLHAQHRALAPPILHYLRQIDAEDAHDRLVLLIPEVRPAKPWDWLLFNQRGFVLERAVQRRMDSVVICRLRYGLATITAGGQASPAEPDEGVPSMP